MPTPRAPDPARRERGRRRLQALGIDPDTLTPEQVRQSFEAWRTAYVATATAGRHFEAVHTDGDRLPGACLHARYGMLTDAIRDYYGAHPPGWSPPRVTWPGPDSQGRVTATQQQTAPARPALRRPPTTLG